MSLKKEAQLLSPFFVSGYALHTPDLFFVPGYALHTPGFGFAMA
jgi:hypothetical protein